MKPLYSVVAVAFLLGFVDSALAQNGQIIKWDTGYPKAGTITGYISVAGTCDTTGGWTVSKLEAKVFYDGRKAATHKLTPGASWSGHLNTGFTGGTEMINVIVEAWFTKEGTTAGPYIIKPGKTFPK